MTLRPAQIRTLIDIIASFVDGLRYDYTKILTKLAKKSYKDGISNAEKSVGKINNSEKKLVYSSMEETSDLLEERIEPIFEAIRRDLTSVLKDCINKNMSYRDTALAIRKRSKYLEKHIPFNSVGKTYTKPAYVNGQLIESMHTITRKKTMNTDTYFNLLTQNVGKMAYLQSKIYSFASKGITDFYIGLNEIAG